MNFFFFVEIERAGNFKLLQICLMLMVLLELCTTMD